MISESPVNRLSLIDFQKKILLRLEQAKTHQLEPQLLKARCANSYYLFDFSQIGGVFYFRPITPVAYTKAWFLGVINLKGAIYNVISLPLFIKAMSASELTDSRVKFSKNKGFFISLHERFNNQIVIHVDEFFGIGLAKDFSEHTVNAAEKSSLNVNYVDKETKNWEKIDFNQLIVNTRFLNISV